MITRVLDNEIMSILAKVKVISFDVEGTLVNFHPPDRIIQLFLKTKGYDVDRDVIKGVIEEIAVPGDQRDPEKFYVEWNEEVLSKLGFRGLGRELLDFWFSPGNYEVFWDVRKTLEKLKALGFKLVIVSNNLSWEIRRLLIREKLDSYIDYIITPDIAGYFKPEKDIFIEAALAVGSRVEQMVHIGDRLEEDYIGATRAGATALLLVREKIPPRNVLWIRCLLELVGEGCEVGG